MPANWIMPSWISLSAYDLAVSSVGLANGQPETVAEFFSNSCGYAKTRCFRLIVKSADVCSSQGKQHEVGLSRIIF